MKMLNANYENKTKQTNSNELPSKENEPLYKSKTDKRENPHIVISKLKRIKQVCVGSIVLLAVFVALYYFLFVIGDVFGKECLDCWSAWAFSTCSVVICVVYIAYMFFYFYALHYNANNNGNLHILVSVFALFVTFVFLIVENAFLFSLSYKDLDINMDKFIAKEKFVNEIYGAIESKDENCTYETIDDDLMEYRRGRESHNLENNIAYYDKSMDIYIAIASILNGIVQIPQFLKKRGEEKNNQVIGKKKSWIVKIEKKD